MTFLIYKKVKCISFGTFNLHTLFYTIGPKWFSKFLTQNNFPHIRFHDLRHTFATLLVNNNVDVNTVSHKLGHASTTTTLQFYVHNLESTDRASAELLENLLIKQI